MWLPQTTHTQPLFGQSPILENLLASWRSYCYTPHCRRDEVIFRSPVIFLSTHPLTPITTLSSPVEYHSPCSSKKARSFWGNRTRSKESVSRRSASDHLPDPNTILWISLCILMEKYHRFIVCLRWNLPLRLVEEPDVLALCYLSMCFQSSCSDQGYSGRCACVFLEIERRLLRWWLNEDFMVKIPFTGYVYAIWWYVFGRRAVSGLVDVRRILPWCVCLWWYYISVNIWEWWLGIIAELHADGRTFLLGMRCW